MMLRLTTSKWYTIYGTVSGIILGMGWVNVTSSLIGWAYTEIHAYHVSKTSRYVRFEHFSMIEHNYNSSDMKSVFKYKDVLKYVVQNMFICVHCTLSFKMYTKCHDDHGYVSHWRNWHIEHDWTMNWHGRICRMWSWLAVNSKLWNDLSYSRNHTRSLSRNVIKDIATISPRFH